MRFIIHWEQVFKRIHVLKCHEIFLGSFGRVKLARNKITNKWVALKILKKAEIIRLKQVDHVINENTLLSNIDHPFIVNFIFLLISNEKNQRFQWTGFVKMIDIYTSF